VCTNFTPGVELAAAAVSSVTVAASSDGWSLVGDDTVRSGAHGSNGGHVGRPQILYGSLARYNRTMRHTLTECADRRESSLQSER
jgi:hypothetical protein